MSGKNVETLVTKVSPPFYDPKANEFFRSTGNASFIWYIVQNDSPSPAGMNSPSRLIRFADTLNKYEYDLYNSGILMSFSICNSGTSANPTPIVPTNPAAGTLGVLTNYVAPVPDAFFDQVRFRIGSTELSAMSGKDNMHKYVHLTRLMTFNPNTQKDIDQYEYFYPDTGLDGGACTTPYSLYSNVLYAPSSATANGTPSATATTATPVVNYYNGGVILNTPAGQSAPTAPVTYTGTGGGLASVVPQTISVTDLFTYQPNGVAANDFYANGNPYFNLVPNQYYNDGFLKRNQRVGNGQGGGPNGIMASGYTGNQQTTTVWIPLRNYVRALNAFKTTISGLAYEIVLRRPIDGETMFSANIAPLTRSGVVNDPPLAGYSIYDIRLCIPAYTPDEAWKSKIMQKLANGQSSIRNYVDCDVIQAPANLSGGSTSCDIVWTQVCNRRPIAAFVAFQLITDYQSQCGSTTRYYNFSPLTAQLKLGSSTYFPEQQLQTINMSGSSVDNATVFREFCRLVPLLQGDTVGCSLTMTDFVNHKYFVPFDLTCIENRGLPKGQSLNVEFKATFPPLPTLPATADLSPRFHGGWYSYSGNPPSTASIIPWLFLFQERAVKVNESLGGISIVPDIGSDEVIG